jgi:hypothetical protein
MTTSKLPTETPQPASAQASDFHEMFSTEAGRTLHGEDAPGKDIYYISPQEKKRFKIGENDKIAFVRNPGIWQKIEMSDAIRNFQNRSDREGAEVVYNEAGEMVQVGDLVAMKYPVKLWEAEEAARLDACKEDQHSDEMPSEGEMNRIKMERKHRQRELLEQQSIIGERSPSYRMRYSDMVNSRGAKAIEEEEARYRSPGARRSYGEAESDWDAIIGTSKISKAAQNVRASSNNKTVSMAGSGFPRNPNSPLSQAQAREQRGSR